MQLRNKYYPYPVIMEDGEYYVDSSFTNDVEQVRDGYNIKLIFKAELRNDELVELLKDGIVEIVHHIECPQTCYRNIVRTRENKIEFLLKDSDVNGVVQVCSFLIAKRKIEKYTNTMFSSDYRGFKFDLEKGLLWPLQAK